MTTAARFDRAALERLVVLLRAELGSAPPPAANAVAATDWGALEHTAELHGFAPFLERLLAPFAECVPQDARERFELRAIGNRLRNRVVGALLREIDEGLAAANAHAILLKGAALLHSLYAEEGPRALSDIDVLVPAAGLDVAAGALATTGFAPAPHPEKHFFRRDMHVVFLRPLLHSIPVEMHWDLAEPYRPYAFDLDAIFAAGRPVGPDWRALHTMSREHTLAYLCVHLERHAIFYRHVYRHIDRDDWLDLVVRGGAGVRLLWLYDVALAVRRWRSAVDWDRFVECCNVWAIAPNVRAALEICRRVFLLAPPDDVIEPLHAGRAGLVGSIASRALTVLPGDVSRRLSESGHTTLVLALSEFFTPSVAYLRQRYGVRTRLPLLRLRHLMEGVALTGRSLLSILHRASRTLTSSFSCERRLPPAPATEANRADAWRHLYAKPHLMAEALPTGLAVYDPEDNAVHRLNSPAARILALCDGSHTTGAIAAELRRQLEPDARVADADVASTIDLLVENGLVIAETEPRSGPD